MTLSTTRFFRPASSKAGASDMRRYTQRPLLFSWASLGLLALTEFGGPSAAAEDGIALGGRIAGFAASYLDRDRDGLEDDFAVLRFRPHLTVTPNDQVLIRLEGDFRRDTLDRGFAMLREGYVDFSRDALRVRIGQQVFDWSATDTVSPSDFLGPRDWTDPVRWERLGVPAIDVRFGNDDFAELVYVPLPLASRLPRQNARWRFDLPAGVVRATPEGPSGLGNLGARIGLVRTGLDLGLAGYYGTGYQPSFHLRPTGAATAEVVPSYRRQTVVAGSVAAELSDFVVRAELGYIVETTGDAFVQGVVGADREWSTVFVDDDGLYGLLQYNDSLTVDADTPAALRALDFRRSLDQSLLGRARYRFGGTSPWRLEFEGSVNVVDGRYSLSPTVVWEQDAFAVEAGVDLLSGPPDTLIGAYRNNDRLFVEITYVF